MTSFFFLNLSLMYEYTRSPISQQRTNEFHRRICSGHASVLSLGHPSSKDLSVLKGVSIWLDSSAPTFLCLEERMVLETFYVLCELCSCPLPTPPQLNIQISGRDSRPPSQPLPFRPPPCARSRNEKKDVGLAKYYHNDVRL